MKSFDNTYVSTSTSSDNVDAMIHQVIRGHRISFCDDEMSFEWKGFQPRLSGWWIWSEYCLLSALRQLRVDLGKLEQNQVNIRAFDGIQRDTLGAVNLIIQMGPAELSAQFQVLDIGTS